MRKHLTLISLLLTTTFPALFSQTLQVGMRWEYLEDSLFWLPQLLQPIISVETLGKYGDPGGSQAAEKAVLHFRPIGPDDPNLGPWIGVGSYPLAN